MALSKAEILDAISQMTVLELSGLIKDMEEKFGVSAAAAAVAVVPIVTLETTIFVQVPLIV